MEIIIEQEAYFLVALNASEESSLLELRRDFERWDISSIDVTTVLKSLVNDGIILLSEREGNNFNDYSAKESLKIVEAWNTSESWNTILYLTEAGCWRWEVEDWGITTKRAEHLVFSNKAM